MPTLRQTTELEAVNAIMATIGDTPVNTIVDTGLLNVEQAVTFLHEESRSVQAEGWHFNTEINYPLTPDVNSFLLAPRNILKIDTTKEYWYYDLVLRGNKLYDRNEHSYLFTDMVKFDMTLYLDYDELPQTARHYIMVKAARLFQARMLGSDTLNAFTKRDEVEARAKLLDEDHESADSNMLTGSHSVYAVIDREI